MARKDIHKDGVNTQFPHNDPTKGGRPVSIRNQIKELLSAEGKIKIDAKQVIRIEEDGSVVIELPTQMQLGMKLMQWALSKRGGDSIKAIQMIMEQIDGKATQPFEDVTKTPELTDEQIQKLIDKT